MIKNEVLLKSPERFAGKKDILSTAKVEKAAENAIRKLEKNIEKFDNSFLSVYSINQKYYKTPLFVDEYKYWEYWTNGMYTGEYWLAYELTGDKKFLDIVKSHYDYYKERKRRGIDEENN